MPVDPNYKIISSRKIPAGKEIFIITSINDSEHKKIKSLEDLHIVRGNSEFNVTPDDVLCSGPIDFHDGSDDSKELDTFNFLDHLGIQGISIPSKYNYDKHECTSNSKYCLWTETFKISTLCRYLHGCLGKPEQTLIFREII